MKKKEVTTFYLLTEAECNKISAPKSDIKKDTFLSVIKTKQQNSDSKKKSTYNTAGDFFCPDKRIVLFGDFYWRVLVQNENGYLLITKDVIERRKFHKVDSDITWAESDIREYLNGEFLQENFSKAERNRIVKADIYTPDNSESVSGIKTEDKVFLLSSEEASSLFHDDSDRIAKYKKEVSWWWLRSFGTIMGYAETVYDDGSINDVGYDVDYENGVRPAIYLKSLDSLSSIEEEDFDGDLEENDCDAEENDDFKEVKFGNIIWYVIAKNENGYLLITKNVIDVRKYHNEDIDITWAGSDIRKYLNSSFLQEFFDQSERDQIIPTKIHTSGNDEYGTEGGANTEDKVFLLSHEEVNTLFHSEASKVATYKDDRTTWWLRSPGNDQDMAAVFVDDIIGEDDDFVDEEYGVRPALYLKSLDSLEIDEYDDEDNEDYECYDEVKFGKFTWLVLSKDENGYLLITKDIIEEGKYNDSEKHTKVTWEESDIRRYLNSAFLQRNFNANEQRQIVEKNVPGKIFLLSSKEAKSLFHNNADRIAKYRGEVSWWWLRTPDVAEHGVVGVSLDGSLYTKGLSAFYDHGIRPALYLKSLDSLEIDEYDDEDNEDYECYDEVKFGKFTWLVLSKDENGYLLITKDIIEEGKYNDSEKHTKVTWEESDIRRYLNSAFLQRNFNANEQRQIVEKNVPGKIFLLSSKEAKSLFHNNADRIAKYRGEVSWWWLRTPDVAEHGVVGVSLDGSLYTKGLSAFYDHGIRPALYLKSLDFLENEDDDEDYGCYDDEEKEDDEENRNTESYDEVKFGKFIWQVVKQDENGYLLVTKDIVELREYHEGYVDVTWAESDIRKYLNDEFLQKNFSMSERIQIVKSRIHTPDNAKCGTKGGKDTRDSIFLLSSEEANSLYPTDASRTGYYNGEATSWWLRSPGSTQYSVLTVLGGDDVGIEYEGFVDIIGSDTFEKKGVRPALYLKSVALLENA